MRAATERSEEMNEQVMMMNEADFEALCKDVARADDCMEAVRVLAKNNDLGNLGPAVVATATDAGICLCHAKILLEATSNRHGRRTRPRNGNTEAA